MTLLLLEASEEVPEQLEVFEAGSTGAQDTKGPVSASGVFIHADCGYLVSPPVEVLMCSVDIRAFDNGALMGYIDVDSISGKLDWALATSIGIMNFSLEILKWI